MNMPLGSVPPRQVAAEISSRLNYNPRFSRPDHWLIRIVRALFIVLGVGIWLLPVMVAVSQKISHP